MRKSTSQIREKLARLQEELKQAETRDAERIGRIALKAGLGEIEIDEMELQAAFEDVAKRFRGGDKGRTIGKERPEAGGGASSSTGSQSATVEAGPAQGNAGEG
ncbi:TraC family protein [Agrobacterium genomosp. 3]|jgi:hypothetical protein|uniref:conjugal transfer protein TraC n=1 Tax=Rhizobium/Agrobacterium group TaxID=227290 RepID=UPI0007151106|nr:conjugal transfer protein TraC [Rhizobium sp. Root149]KQZ46745.1 conjugal transfer protein TraC [Rhizobium sp. Root149]MCA1869462.1 TraC family protein [Agrobacterium tomkonis]MCA1879790.1 TraC family protein [Agrobacterium tumefaciens]MCA1895038.1 TraC family protein [Agrobacterium tomkonis]